VSGMSFIQSPPELGNQFDADRMLKSYLQRTLGADGYEAVSPGLNTMGELAGGELFALQAEDRLAEPTLVQWDAWGNRVDRIELTRMWRRAQVVAAEHGVVATAYDGKLGARNRVHQFALVYLFDPASDTYTCPLAMTDGAAATLVSHEATPLVERAVAHLTSRDPKTMWTSGQWMTERAGGSDVGLSETVAAPTGGGAYGMDHAHRLEGTKWFTSAATSEMALTLARPVGEPEGGRGLTLFYLEMKDEYGASNGIRVNRLKDKLGTRKLPTAELTLDGALAVPVAGIGHGIRNIAPMLNVTRTWNAVSSVAAMRRGLALARDYATRRVQFGAPLSDKPLHVDTLAGMAAETEAALLLAFRLAELLGRVEHREQNEREDQLLRLLTPVAKLTTAKQAVAITSEVLECFGGAGYVEDTGVAKLLRDAQVLPIWEGTTNVLSLDLLRALSRGAELGALTADIDERLEAMQDGAMKALADRAKTTIEGAGRWLMETTSADRSAVEAGARRFALTVGRSYQLALLAHHADWCLRTQSDPRSSYAASRFARHGIDQLQAPVDAQATAALALG
jgi:alkylation response protein AidB-like acyl-CoA dehydrogenase